VSLASDACKFAAHTGHVPTDGAELLLFLFPTLNEKQGLDDFMAWDSERQLDYIQYRINPASGKLHENFGHKSWTTGGIDIRRASLADFREYNPSYIATFERLGEPLPPGYVLVFYGSEPESIVFDALMLSITDPTGTKYFDRGNVRGPHVPGGPFVEPINENPPNPCGSNPCNPCSENPCTQVNDH
jgi:hypothetical protein